VDCGDAKEAMALSSPEDRPDADYVVTGKYSIWKDIVEGKQEPLRAIMTRKLRLSKGSQLKILKQASFAVRMISNCTKVETEFVDAKGS
jgi:putative sterol carrier protein